MPPKYAILLELVFGPPERRRRARMGRMGLVGDARAPWRLVGAPRAKIPVGCEHHDVTARAAFLKRSDQAPRCSPLSLCCVITPTPRPEHRIVTRSQPCAGVGGPHALARPPPPVVGCRMRPTIVDAIVSQLFYADLIHHMNFQCCHGQFDEDLIRRDRGGSSG